LYTDPEPDPLPLEVETAIETTDGVTREEMVFVFIPFPPISIRVRPLEQVPLLEMKSAPVRLSAQAFTEPVGWVIAAVAIDPATAAPATNAATNLPVRENEIFIIQIMPNFSEFFLLEG
jgi:hypothetical protein